MSRARVLVVDDSAFARKVLREVLQASPLLEVVGTARDGLDALAKIDELDPDLVTLDLAMPHLDGVETLRALSGKARPKVIVVSMAGADSDAALDALAAGAIDIVHKPTALATDQLYELSKELVFKVEAAATARPATTATSDTASERKVSEKTRHYRGRYDLLLLGASTGGPQAITQVLKALPADFPVPIAVVLHLPHGFTQGYAERLNEVCALDVREAQSGVRLAPGSVVIAPGGSHLRIERDSTGLFGVIAHEPRSLHRPSLDELFGSAARATADRTLAVVMTGMGDDGLLGSRALRERGADVLVQSERSCVVYGMPRVVSEAGLATAEHDLYDLSAAILARI